MIVLSGFCSVCLHDGEELHCLNALDFDNIPLMSKLNYCSVENVCHIILFYVNQLISAIVSGMGGNKACFHSNL